MDHVFDDGEDIDLDNFCFDLDLDDDNVQSVVPKRQRRKGPVVANNVPEKNDIRRYLPHLLMSVINSTDFSKLLTFFHSFMTPDGKYDLEYAGMFTYPVCESRGPELTAFMFTGLGVMFPDMTLSSSDITISTNNVNSISKITMECSFHFSKIYNVTLEWALGQLQGIYRANQPNPYRDVRFQHSSFYAISLRAALYSQYQLQVQEQANKGKTATKRTRGPKIKNENDSEKQNEIPFFAGFRLALPQLRSAIPSLSTQLTTRDAQVYGSSTCSNAGSSAHTSAESSACNSATNSARNSECSSKPELSDLFGDIDPSELKHRVSHRSSGYDLSVLAYSVFSQVPQLFVPIACSARCTYTITMDGNRIKHLYVSAMQAPPKIDMR